MRPFTERLLDNGKIPKYNAGQFCDNAEGSNPHSPLSGNAEGIVPRTSRSRKNKCLHPSTGLELRLGGRTVAGGKCFQPSSHRGTNVVEGLTHGQTRYWQLHFALKPRLGLKGLTHTVTPSRETHGAFMSGCFKHHCLSVSHLTALEKDVNKPSKCQAQRFGEMLAEAYPHLLF